MELVEHRAGGLELPVAALRGPAQVCRQRRRTPLQLRAAQLAALGPVGGAQNRVRQAHDHLVLHAKPDAVAEHLLCLAIGGRGLAQALLGPCAVNGDGPCVLVPIAVRGFAAFVRGQPQSTLSGRAGARRLERRDCQRPPQLPAGQRHHPLAHHGGGGVLDPGHADESGDAMQLVVVEHVGALGALRLALLGRRQPEMYRPDIVQREPESGRGRIDLCQEPGHDIPRCQERVGVVLVVIVGRAHHRAAVPGAGEKQPLGLADGGVGGTVAGDAQRLAAGIQPPRDEIDVPRPGRGALTLQGGRSRLQDPVDPGPRGVDRQPRAHLELGAGDDVPGHDALHPGAVVQQRHGLDVIGRHRAGINRIPDALHRNPRGIQHLAVVPVRAAGHVVAIERRVGRCERAVAHHPRPRQADLRPNALVAPRGDHVERDDAAGQRDGSPGGVAVGRDDEPQGAHQVRREAEPGPLRDHRLADSRHVEMLDVPQAAVDQLG